MCCSTELSDASVAALVGAGAATVGIFVLWLTQTIYQKRRQSTEETNRHTVAGHNAMMTLDAQRGYVEALFATLNGYKSKRKTIEDVPSIYANHNSVPRIHLNELGFLIERAKDKNILPKLIGIQQNFDQLIDILNRAASERQYLHYAKQDRNAYEAGSICLNESEEHLFDLINQMLEKYPIAQSKLESGLKETISNFNPIYKR